MRSSDKVLAYLAEARLAVGDQLPAEIDLARKLQVSRNSIREAYAQLAARGVLVRRHGIGTFVSKRPIINDFDDRRAFWRMIESAGYTPSLIILSQSRARADDDLAAMIVAPGKGAATRLDWLFCADGNPVVFIQHAVASMLRLEHVDWSGVHNLLAALADQIAAFSPELEVTNTAVNAPPEAATKLGIKRGAAVIHGVAKVHLAGGITPIVSRHWSNPDYAAIKLRQPLTAEQLQA
jgi:GntR family transcriptional regulator